VAALTVAVSLSAASAPSTAAQANAAPINTEEAACALVKARVAARGHFPISEVAFCDVAVATADRPQGFFVLALHSKRVCDGICSTNMGWFAVEKATGRVFEWDMAEDRLGPPIKLHP